MIVNVSPVTVAHTIQSVEIRFDEFALKATKGACTVLYLSDHRVVKIERVEIPEDVYTSWGTDDQVIIDYVLSQLNLMEA